MNAALENTTINLAKAYPTGTLFVCMQHLEQYRQVMTARGRARFGRIAVEGTRLVERALRAGWSVEHAIYHDTFLEKARHKQLLTELTAAGGTCVCVPAATMTEFTGARNLGGIIALVTLPPEDRTVMQNRGMFAVAADVVEPGNVGALMRSAHGMGAAAFVAVGSSDPYNPKAVRTSMGSVFKLPVIRFATLAAFQEAAAMTLIGSVAAAGIPLPDLVCDQRVAVVMGSEFHGLSAAQQAVCDQLVTIPMADGIDSFSVSAAGAILFYTVGRQV